ncbi:MULTISPECIES: hypothetical protein [Asticcacaulis]|uniref:hypothetical protein n=1 Tax=Asticcacaulis TaxID=76890 RepID=UPI001AE4118F|nr:MULTISPECIES: hypothetical protein [Asticcacaulis]MBP2157640.1 uncharacterized membrane protein YgdD (TMEM256/DUF423 family) [Asticcacaulis solisilvae]MDR6798685.1 uncharacterized membrane protein YgdD (TMEM256/DUF423 family) [Asticcacaulis sp. BE141]
MDGQRILLGIAALWGLLGMLMLAAGSHPPRIGVLAVGGQVMMFHAVAALALINTTLVTGWRRALPVALMLTGSGLFGLSMWLRTAGVLDFGLLAPIGGGLAIVGWIVLAVSALLPARDTSSQP